MTINDFKHRVILKKYHDRMDDVGHIKRKKKVVVTCFAAVEPMALSTAHFPKGLPKMMDGSVLMQVAYKLYIKENISFDEIEWKGERFLRASFLQQEGAFFKCIVAAIEEKIMGEK